VRVVAVAGTGEAARTRAARVGVDVLADDSDLGRIPDLLEADGEPVAVIGAPLDDLEEPVACADAGRIVVVWGPAGAPGRTTVATALAATLASRGIRTTLVDADPYGGSAAQHLGVLDEVSGLLSAARLTGDGMLEARFGSVQRALGDHLTVVTGLPRPDRWVEVRAGVVEHLLEVARAHGHVVVDTGFCLEDDPGGDLVSRPGRNHLTLAALDVADDVVVVGSADPVGLSRLARGLVDLRERRGGAPLRVVVNRMRASLAWSERDIAGMVEGFTRLAGIHFLPDDRAAADRALVTASSVVDAGDSELGRALGGVADALVPTSAPTPGNDRRITRRRAGRARPR
jgi:MinD-like ATPase involved in chromosome partitioning or flagellar assembly